MQFNKATRKQARLRMALIGPAGSGKTYTSLAVATALGQRVALIDTERGSASKYAGIFDFDVLDLTDFNPRRYVEALEAAGQAGYDVVIVDSLSHAWAGKGGALEMVDKAAARMKVANSFAAWREVTPQHTALVDALLASPYHLIATMRTKTEYRVERDERTGKSAPRKIGLAPIQRENLEYEFDVVGVLDEQNTLVVTKTRCPELAGAVLVKPGQALAETLRRWLEIGVAASPPPPSPGPGGVNGEQTVSIAQVEQLNRLIVEVEADLPRFLKCFDIVKLADLPAHIFPVATSMLRRKIKKTNAADTSCAERGREPGAEG